MFILNFFGIFFALDLLKPRSRIVMKTFQVYAIRINLTLINCLIDYDVTLLKITLTANCFERFKTF